MISVGRAFEVLDHRSTDLGDLILRRRGLISRGGESVWEVMLDGRLLMSSLVNDSERALAQLGLNELGERPCSVLVGGLGLGSTAREALACPHVDRLVVIELLDPVLQWHTEGLVPHAAELLEDDRCEIRIGDFFSAFADVPDASSTWDAILLDIDHSPEFRLRGSPAEFYQRDGLQQLRRHIAPGGVFAVWSADDIDHSFLGELDASFETARAEPITFRNPMLDRDDTNVIYVATA